MNAGRVGRAELAPGEAAYYGEGAERVLPETIEELADIVRDAEAHARPIIPAGQGAHAGLGNSLHGSAPLVVSLERLGRVLRYEPEDFTIGVQAGMPLAELRDVLGENGQDVVADRAAPCGGTVGGLLAAGLSSPRRASRGTLRSWLIGVRAMRGGARIYKAGGMVVKNVAGYDVGKLLAGSLGTAGIILEANFKLRPLPRARRAGIAWIAGPAQAFAFAAALRAARLEPAALFVLSPDAALTAPDGGRISGSEGCWQVCWLFEGNRALVDWLESRADALIAGAPVPVAGVARADDAGAARVLDALCAAIEPGAPTGDREALIRTNVLPGEIAELAGEITAATPPAAPPAVRIVADAACGDLYCRIVGEPPALESAVAAFVDRLSSLMAARAAQSGASACTVSLPPSLRRRHPYLLPGGAGARPEELRVASRILAVFDPRGLFCPGRLHGATRGG